MNYTLIDIRKQKEYTEKAAQWFHEKWGVDAAAYIESMEEGQNSDGAYPLWYIIMDGERIISGLGVIENDFHERKDLAPNICAVFTEEEYRKQGLSKYLMDLTCAELSRRGCDTTYLITSHTEFYEHCGFEFFCSVKEDCGSTARMYRRISKCGASMEAIRTFLDNAGRITAMPAKRKLKLHCFIYLAEKFVCGKTYSEKEVNALLNEWHIFGDPVTFRRELCDHKILLRDDYGKEYRRAEILPTYEELEKLYG